MMLELLVLAETNKKRAATAMNDRSSRSHSILVFNISQKNKKLDSLVKSVLHVVDLAGSERLKKSKVGGREELWEWGEGGYKPRLTPLPPTQG